MNKKYFFIFAICILLTLSLFVTARPKWKNPVCPINSNTDIAFYGETGFGGVGAPSKSWMIHFLDWWKTQDPSIDYAELSSNDVKGNCDLKSFSNLKLYIQPGGDAYYMQNKLGASGKSNILNYLNSGGSYFGACAGWYYNAVDYFWQGDYYNHADMLDYYPATVEGSITDIADYDGNPDNKLTTLSTGFNAIYYGGPTIGWHNTQGPAPGITEATFTEIPGDLPAIIKYNGNTLLTSVHLEAFENDGITGLTTEDRIENYKYLANLINEVAGTNFYVPSYTNPPQPECNDGIDNDNDGLVDLQDLGCLNSTSDNDETNCGDLVCEANSNETWQTCPLDCQVPQCADGIDNDNDSLIDYPADLGCSSFEDNDETDITGPVELLNDGFEDGNLVEWTLSGSGRSWSVSSDTSQEGVYSARAKRTGAGKNSYMELSIDGSAYDSLTFDYYRKLVGLDAADNFEASYYDNGWFNVESLGSSSENNANFVHKNYNIPKTATKIRFMCECGAVSEKCYVDNVKVIAQ